MQGRQTFSPIDKPPEVHEIGAFDFETVGDGAEYSSGAATFDGKSIFTTDLDMLLEFISTHSKRKVRWYAHNLSYDFGAILLDLNCPISARFVDGRLYKARFMRDGYHWTRLYDSLQMLGGLPLRSIGKQIGLPKYPTPPQFLPGGSDVRQWRCDEHNRVWCSECYNMRDTEIVAQGMKGFQEEVNRLGGQVKNTIAGTAMDIFRRSYLDTEYLTPFRYRNRWARPAYYGGRTEAFGLGKWEDVYVSDFHSLYPSVMRERSYPDPNYLIGPTTEPPRGVVDDYEGISEVTVYVPKMAIPPLPFRGKYKLYFPYGKWKGRYTHAELRYAKTLGCKVLRVHDTLYSKRACQPFDDYVNTVYSLRMEYKARGDPRQLFVKILLNSLYGRFGIREVSPLQRLAPEDYALDHELPTGAEPVIYYDTYFWRLPVPIPNQPVYANTPWAAYITSYARIKLHKAMMATPYRVLYCDTDSIFATGPLPDKEGLGELGAEVKGGEVILYGCKSYKLMDAEGNEKYAVKGVPEAARKEYLRRGKATYKKPLQFWEANAKGRSPSEWVEVTKRMRNVAPKRRYGPLRDVRKDNAYSAPWPVRRLPLLHPEDWSLVGFR